MKFFNTIPGDGEVAILLYGDVGDGQKVDSGRVVSVLMFLHSASRGTLKQVLVHMIQCIYSSTL